MSSKGGQQVPTSSRESLTWIARSCQLLSKLLVMTSRTSKLSSLDTSIAIMLEDWNTSLGPTYQFMFTRKSMASLDGDTMSSSSRQAPPNDDLLYAVESFIMLTATWQVKECFLGTRDEY